MRIKTGLVLLVAILAAGCTARTLPSQPPLAVNPVQFSANEWRVPSQAVVIADASGTTYMAKTFPQVKALTQSFVKAMPDGNSRAKVSEARLSMTGISIPNSKRLWACRGS